jgi:hypothetical protein
MIFSESPSQHEHYVRQMLSKLRAADFQADIRKNEFSITETRFLVSDKPSHLRCWRLRSADQLSTGLVVSGAPGPHLQERAASRLKLRRATHNKKGIDKSKTNNISNTSIVDAHPRLSVIHWPTALRAVCIFCRLAVYFSPPLQLQIAQFSKPNTTTFSRSRRPSILLSKIVIILFRILWSGEPKCSHPDNTFTY